MRTIHAIRSEESIVISDSRWLVTRGVNIPPCDIRAYRWLRCRGKCRVEIIHSLIFHRHSINVKTRTYAICSVFLRMMIYHITRSRVRIFVFHRAASKETKLLYHPTMEHYLCNLYGLLNITANFFVAMYYIDLTPRTDGMRKGKPRFAASIYRDRLPYSIGCGIGAEILVRVCDFFLGQGRCIYLEPSNEKLLHYSAIIKLTRLSKFNKPDSSFECVFEKLLFYIRIRIIRE